MIVAEGFRVRIISARARSSACPKVMPRWGRAPLPFNQQRRQAEDPLVIGRRQNGQRGFLP